MFKVQFSYQPDSRVPNGLPVSAGEAVVVLNQLSDNWLTAKAVKDGSIGLVPTAYVQEVTEPDPPFDVYVAKHEGRTNEANHLSLKKGAKVELLMKDSAKKWTVRDIESQQVGLTPASNLIKSSEDQCRRSSASAVEDALDGRFVFTKKPPAKEEKGKRSRKKNKQKAKNEEHEEHAKDDDCVSRDTVDSIPDDSKIKRSHTFSGRVFSGSGRGKKDIADKVAREELLIQIDETISALKKVGHKKGQPSTKQAITELTRVRHSVSKGRDFDVARCLLSGKPLPGKENGQHDVQQVAASASVGSEMPDGGQSASLSRTSSVPTDTTSKSFRKGSMSVSRPSAAPPPPPPGAANTAVSPSSDVPHRQRALTSSVVRPTRAPPVPVRSTPLITRPERAAPPPPPQSGTPTSLGQRPSPQPPVPQAVTPTSASRHSPQNPNPQAGVGGCGQLASPPQARDERQMSLDIFMAAAQAPPKPRRTSGTPKLLRSESGTPSTPPVEDAAALQISHNSAATQKESQDKATETHSDSLGSPVKSLPTVTAKSPFTRSGLRASLVRRAGDVMGTRWTAASCREASRSLVEDVRSKTGVPFDKSCAAVQSVLEQLKSYLPDKSTEFDELMEAVAQLQVSQAEGADGLKSNKDGQRLDVIFSELTTMKNDAQQRNWTVHDDEDIIKEYLEELLTILSDAESSVCAGKVRADEYAIVHTLVEYYQMEARVSIRMLLLQLFGGLCSLDREVPSVLLHTILPLELGRDIQSNTSDLQKMLFSCLVCTMVFSCGEKFPVGYYETWSVDFMLFLLNLIEFPPDEEESERILEVITSLILAFNYHFSDIEVTENIVMKALVTAPNTKSFCEKILLLLNRNEDPVALNQPLEPNSLLKLTKDMFAQRSTAGLFYTTDTFVLIDIIARELYDLPSESEARFHYLLLLEELVETTDYLQHLHRRDTLSSALERLLQEENPEKRNVETVGRIRQLCPQLNKS